MFITKTAVKLAVPSPDVEGFSRFLFIGPHPDDIEIGAGATAAKLAAAGKQVCFLICTDGRYGDGFLPAGTPPEEVIRIRRQEAVDSAHMLGVDDIRFLELSDGGFYSFEELEAGIAAVVGDFKPDIIFCPDPDVANECHRDHLNVGRAAKHMAYLAPYSGIMEKYGAAAAQVKAIAFYMTASPNRFVKTGKYYHLQLDSVFRCHLSQFPEGSAEKSSLQLYLGLRAREAGLINFCSAAEGFRVLGQTHMHCLPEAGL